MPELGVEEGGAAGEPAKPAKAPAESGGLRGMSLGQRLLAGACATLIVLGVTSAIAYKPPPTGGTGQVAAGPSQDQPPEDTTSTTATTAPPAGLDPLAPLGPPPSRPAGPNFIATALIPSVDIFSSPGASEPTRQMANPQPSGAPLVMLVRDQQEGWVNVFLPIRPNGSSGWVRRDQVAVAKTDYYMIIGLAPHRITVFKGNSIVLDERVGLGAGGKPTPSGLFYIKELLRPPNPAGAYGPYAYGLSAFSEVLFNFGGGPGTVGVHGTNDPSSLGRNVSNGCIRMSNSGVTKLSKMLPLGVPVQIT